MLKFGDIGQELLTGHIGGEAADTSNIVCVL